MKKANLFLLLSLFAFVFFFMQKKENYDAQLSIAGEDSKQVFIPSSLQSLKAYFTNKDPISNTYTEADSFESNYSEEKNYTLDLKLQAAGTPLNQIEGIRFNTSLSKLSSADINRLAHQLELAKEPIADCLKIEACQSEKNLAEVMLYLNSLEALHSIENLQLEEHKDLLFEMTEKENLPKLQENAVRIALNALDTHDLINYWQDHSLKLSPKGIELLSEKAERLDNQNQVALQNEINDFMASQFEANSGRALSQIQILSDISKLKDSEFALEKIMDGYCEQRKKVSDEEFRQSLDYNLQKSLRRSGASLSLPRC